MEKEIKLLETRILSALDSLRKGHTQSAEGILERTVIEMAIKERN